jgi:hypothetical protein
MSKLTTVDIPRSEARQLWVDRKIEKRLAQLDARAAALTDKQLEQFWDREFKPQQLDCNIIPDQPPA